MSPALVRLACMESNDRPILCSAMAARKRAFALRKLQYTALQSGQPPAVQAAFGPQLSCEAQSTSASKAARAAPAFSPLAMATST